MNETLARTQSPAQRIHSRNEHSQADPRPSRTLTPPPASNEKRADRQAILTDSLQIRDIRQGQAAVYRLPYRTGTRQRVVQGYGGTFTHQGNTFYSIDFSMHPGTPVHAARAGVVAAVKSDSQKSGTSKDYLDFANYVSIAHADGTYAEYAHLKYQGVVVTPGDRVEQGQLIGYSGNTGYSKGPHLHFAVLQVTSAEESTTIPVTFLTDEGIVEQLKTNSLYKAVDTRD